MDVVGVLKILKLLFELVGGQRGTLGQYQVFLKKCSGYLNYIKKY